MPPRDLPYDNELLVQNCSVGSCIVGLNHVDRECIVLTRVTKTVRDVGLSLSVTTDVLNIEVHQIVVVLKQRLICSGKEVICCIVDIKPYLLLRALA